MDSSALRLGQTNINRRADAAHDYMYVGSAVPALPNYKSPDFLTDNANSRFIMGFAAGLGVDVMLYSGLFLRAEWEYLRFTETVDTSVNTVRVGLGYKF